MSFLHAVLDALLPVPTPQWALSVPVEDCSIQHQKIENADVGEAKIYVMDNGRHALTGLHNTIVINYLQYLETTEDIRTNLLNDTLTATVQTIPFKVAVTNSDVATKYNRSYLWMNVCLKESPQDIYRELNARILEQNFPEPAPDTVNPRITPTVKQNDTESREDTKNQANAGLDDQTLNTEAVISQRDEVATRLQNALTTYTAQRETE